MPIIHQQMRCYSFLKFNIDLGRIDVEIYRTTSGNIFIRGVTRTKVLQVAICRSAEPAKQTHRISLDDVVFRSCEGRVGSV